MGSWPLLPLGELTENFDSRRVPVKESDRCPGPYPYYGASGIVDHVAEYLFEGEHLLIAEDGENLRSRNTPIAFLASGRFWVNNHAHVVRGNERAITRYLCYALAQTDVSGYLTGSTLPKLTQGSLTKIPVPAPPLPEQRAIASVLGSLDDKIDLNRRMNATLEATARAIFKAWFVDFEALPVDTGRHEPVAMVAERAAAYGRSDTSAVGARIPPGWGMSSVGEQLETALGGTPSRAEVRYWEGGSVPWINSGKANEFRVISPSERITESGLRESATKLLPKRTTILAITGATLGQVSLLEIEACANQSIVGILPSEVVPPEYVYLWIKENIGSLVARQTGGAQQHVNTNDVKALPLLVPSPEVLRAFSRLTRPMFDQIAGNCFQSATLAALRDTLLPKLLSGEVRVKDIA